MGTLFYGSARTPVIIDDSNLAHLRLLLSSKFRRNEGFMLSWDDAETIGDGASSIWLHNQMDVHFKFDGKRPGVNRETLDAMALEAASNSGLELGDATLAWDPRPDLDPGLAEELGLPHGD